MIVPMTPLASFAADADVIGDDAMDPRWFAAAQFAQRLMFASDRDRRALLRRARAHDEWHLFDGVPGPLTPVVASRACRRVVDDMERAGAFHSAWATLSALRVSAAETSDAESGECAAQMGRVARQMGKLDTAADCYEAAAEDAEAANDDALRARVVGGAGSLAFVRGNYPEGRRCFEQVLALAPPGSPLRMNAHQGLTLTALKVGDPAAALTHAWAALDLSSAGDEPRAESLVYLGNVAQRLGRHSEALRAYWACLAVYPPLRIQMPALRAAVRSLAAVADWGGVRTVALRLRALVGTSAQPYEDAMALVELAEAWHQAGEREEAEECLAGAVDLGERHGFHEVTVRADALRKRVERSMRLVTPPRAWSPEVERQLGRFDELTVVGVHHVGTLA
jgi:tetratricopeptide (TPR) repeat protein